MVEVAEAAEVISSLRWKEVVRGKIRHHRSRGEGKKWTGFDPTGMERAAKVQGGGEEVDCLRFHWAGESSKGPGGGEEVDWL